MTFTVVMVILGFIAILVISQKESKSEQVKEALSKLLSNDFVILDLETTGLTKTSEIVEISIIDTKGNVLFDSLIKPKRKIPKSAIDIHGITNEMVANSPKWTEVYLEVKNILESKGTIAYNAEYDDRILEQTCNKYDLPIINTKCECAMLLYALWFGERKPSGGYKWKKLVEAAKYCGIKDVSGAHRSLADCYYVLGILKYMHENKVRK